MWKDTIKNKNGTIKYRFYERYCDPLTGKCKKACITLNSNNYHAQKIAQKLLQEKITKLTSRSPATLSFTNVAQEWLKHQAPSLKLSSNKNNEGIVKKLGRILPQDVLIGQLDVPMIQDVLYKLYHESKLSFGYVQKHFIVIKSVLRYAKRLKYLTDISFIDDVELKQRPKSPEEIRKERNKFLERDELTEVLGALSVKHKRIALSMEFMALTGLRFGELVALRECDYDREKKEVDINGSISHIKNNKDEFRRGTPKNNYSIRRIYLSDRADEIINDFIISNKNMIECMGLYKNQGYIFTSPNGNPINIQLANKVLRSIEYHKNLTTHIFRHTYISLLVSLGIDTKAIMQNVGHNDPRTTIGTYTHVAKNMSMEIAHKLNALKEETHIGYLTKETSQVCPSVKRAKKGQTLEKQEKNTYHLKSRFSFLTPVKSGA